MKLKRKLINVISYIVLLYHLPSHKVVYADSHIPMYLIYIIVNYTNDAVQIIICKNIYAVPETFKLRFYRVL